MTLTRERGPAGEGLAVTLSDLHAANKARQTEWCTGGDPEPDLAFRGNELAGETGEACNVIKKLERERHGWRGSRATLDDLAQELADVIICTDLCAITAGIDLAAAVVAKFNATSEKQGLSTKLAPASQAAPVAGVEKLAADTVDETVDPRILAMAKAMADGRALDWRKMRYGDCVPQQHSRSYWVLLAQDAAAAKLKPCPWEEEHLCCYPKCNCAPDREPDPPPPGDAERLDLGELDRLRHVAQGRYEMLRECQAEFKALGSKGLVETIEKALSASRPDGTGGRDQMGATPMGSGYSGFAPSPMVSASGEYPSRSQSAMVRRLTEEYCRVNWPSMSPAGQHYARNHMTDALRKSGFGLVALGTEAGTAKTEGLGPKDDGPADLSATPQPDPVGEAKALLEGLDLDAERFRALMRCGRIKMQGSAGVDPKTGERTYPEHPGSVHFGAEFWVQPEAKASNTTIWGRHCLRALADDILAFEADLVVRSGQVNGVRE